MQGGGPLDASLSGKSWRKAEKGKGHGAGSAEEASNEEPTSGAVCFFELDAHLSFFTQSP